jgi:putative colanic acid biosynthesis acetyltransferase WcaF
MSASVSHRSLGARRGKPYDKGRGVLAQALWVGLQGTIFTRVWCPNRLRIALLRAFGAQIGDGVLIRHRVRIQWPWNLTVGDNSWVGSDVELYNLDHITIGNDVWTGHHVYITDQNHGYENVALPISQQSQPERAVVIGDETWLGYGSVVLPGVTIGKHVVIGANSVVTRDIPDYSVAVGSPARVVRKYVEGTGWVSVD